jgi:transketolase
MLTRSDLANAVRALSMDAVEKAKSGHPGMPMGMANIAEVLWNDFLVHDPARPDWANRDRFVLSNGHGSMLLYSVLHLSGYDLSIDDLKAFRQLHSKTPGHPEYGYTPGVETTTGPLGQGLANAVGMALAERTLAAEFNRPGFDLINHFTYVFVGDGCLMEGISHEAASLAGTLGLGKLVVLYDDNNISIDGEVGAWFSDDTPARFRAYGWQVVEDVDGHDVDALRAAVDEARGNRHQPTLVCCKTTIGFGSPNKGGKESSHGAPLGGEEIALTRQALNWPHAAFEIPDSVYAGWNARQQGAKRSAAWDEQLAAYTTAHPEAAAELQRRLAGELPQNWAQASAEVLEDVISKGENIATRAASKNALNGFGPLLPELIGGSADLAGSNLTIWAGSKAVSHDDAHGNYVYFGVREFAMAAMCNGISLYGGFVPYAATFLMFSEYARNALRMAALMRIRNIFVFTHDSVGLGEDGPTHQAVEQAATLRMLPNMSVWRPCDAVESTIAWQLAVERKDGPTSLLFSRQGLPHQQRSKAQLQDIKRGGYVLKDCAGAPQIIFIATGSEVQLALDAAAELGAAGTAVRVVSMPCAESFDAQDDAYRANVLPPHCRARVALEAGVSDYWRKYVGLDGAVIGIDTFGESAPASAVFEHFGFTTANVVQTARNLLAQPLAG